MNKLKYLKVLFEGEIAAHEIPAFRGAIAQKVGLGHILFHNHQWRRKISALLPAHSVQAL